jgi:hypothetical protein
MPCLASHLNLTSFLYEPPSHFPLFPTSSFATEERNERTRRKGQKGKGRKDGMRGKGCERRDDELFATTALLPLPILLSLGSLTPALSALLLPPASSTHYCCHYHHHHDFTIATITITTARPLFLPILHPTSSINLFLSLSLTSTYIYISLSPPSSPSLSHSLPPPPPF